MAIGPLSERETRLKLAHDLRGSVQAMQQALVALRFAGLPEEPRVMMLNVLERQLTALTVIARDLATDVATDLATDRLTDQPGV